MPPIIFVNCRRQPFIQRMVERSKLYETRTKNTLGAHVGARVLLAETGRGRATVKAAATITEAVTVDRAGWEDLFQYLGIDAGSLYDWQPGMQKKVLYRLEDVQPVETFPVPENAVRHGRAWCEL